MGCDPVTELVTGSGGQVVCPRCGRAEDLPERPVFVVTGASGSGKSTVYPHVRSRLPDYEVFDMDLIIDYASSTWDDFRSAWLMVAHGVALNGRSTVLCGSLIPHEVDRLPVRRFLGPIHYANLDAPDEVLADRLRARPRWRGWDEERIREHQTFAGHLRKTISPTFSTGNESPDEVARRVAAWVTGTPGMT